MPMHSGQGSWSAWWWSRVAAATVRILHELIGESHAAFVYVDDFLILVPESQAPLVAALAQMLMASLSIPLSWHKVRCGPQVSYLGFEINAASGEIGIPEDKLQRILDFLHLRKGNRICKRTIEQGRGRMLWVTSLGPSRVWFCSNTKKKEET